MKKVKLAVKLFDLRFVKFDFLLVDLVSLKFLINSRNQHENPLLLILYHNDLSIQIHRDNLNLQN
ncbi:MAG: hypothetical protein CMK89_06715 [Pseudomonadales bacterium]|nr:hypothetical protein [Pseudomonadales bacterium]